MIRLYVEADTPAEAASVVAELKRLGVAAHRAESHHARTASGEHAEHTKPPKRRHLHLVEENRCPRN